MPWRPEAARMRMNAFVRLVLTFVATIVVVMVAVLLNVKYRWFGDDRTFLVCLFTVIFVLTFVSLMIFPIQCPYCRQKLRINELTRARCPKCESPFKTGD